VSQTAELDHCRLHAATVVGEQIHDSTDVPFVAAVDLDAQDASKMLVSGRTLGGTAFIAHSMATAKSLPEFAKIQSDYLQKIAAQATEQTKEFFDLSTRATQHVFEKVQDATTNSFKYTA
jgi:phasin family protein